MNRIKGAPVLALAAVLMAGCGGSVQALDEDERAGLHARVQDVRGAAADDDTAAARAAIAAFRADVRRLLATGQIDAAEAQRLLDEADAVAAALPAAARPASPAPARASAKDTSEARPEPEARAPRPVRAAPADDGGEFLRALRAQLDGWRDHKGKGAKHRGGWKHDDD